MCSESWDTIIRIWDIETTKQFNVFKEHEGRIMSVKYGSNELMNTILSGSNDKSVRLWDIRSGEQIQMFNGHSSKELYSIAGGNEEDNGISSLKFVSLKNKVNDNEQKLKNDFAEFWYIPEYNRKSVVDSENKNIQKWTIHIKRRTL
ncbi:WD-40 repeat-containing protein [Reticulomyxa filosa]|uniref:WD-40 repeat-containing protein n=1 Tax=Reticulomyxa filosa TaxID=46433 RepID=X6PAA7_RETFI|nr:WD-40 repeat-containing protein [Reticulomyxa filosa]|eukprot:ETO34582.1 WD-40 repeat-containing protein [Reticulomyxa filosa]